MPDNKQTQPHLLLRITLNKKLMLLPKGERIGRMRRERIANEVGPLVARGATKNEVAQALGISPALAAKDIQYCFEFWHESQLAAAEKWRPLIVQRYEMLFIEAFQAWEQSKTSNRPSAKFLDTASNCLEKLSRLLGIQLDVTFLQNNLSLAPTTAATSFAPLDAEAYAELLQGGSLQPLNSIPPFHSSAASASLSSAADTSI